MKIACTRRIYVASSWHNGYQHSVVKTLRLAGHEVYDFKNPNPNDTGGFHWSEIDPAWKEWTQQQFAAGLEHDIAKAGFESDFAAMQWADVFVLVLPCGRSAHLEAGWASGRGKPVIVYIPEKCEPELMYKLTDKLVFDLAELVGAVDSLSLDKQPTSLAELTARAHANSRDKGFWDGSEHNIAEKLCLIHSEVSEALEESRTGADPRLACGFASELADVVIRVMDLAGWLGIDLEKIVVEKMAYNKTRPYKHGKKF